MSRGYFQEDPTMKHSKIALAATSCLSLATAPRVRGITAVRADVDTIPAALAELRTTFANWRQRHDEQVAQLTQTVEAQEQTIAALRVGGGASTAPGAGMHRGDRRRMPIDAAIAADFRAQLQGRPSATMTTQSGPDGGFTVAPEIDNVIDATLRDTSPMRSICRVVQLGSGRGDWEKIIGRSGAQSAWAGEEDDRDDTDSPTLGKVTIAPHELYAVPMLTNHVIEDSAFDLASFLQEDVSGEFALTEGAAFITGEGMNKPRGFLTYDTTTEADSARAFGTLQYVPTGASGDFAANDPADILFDTVQALRPVYRRGPGVSWLMNSATANVVRKFKDGNGRFMWSDSLMEGQPDRLCGYPVALDEGMPDIGADEFAIAFGNWQRGYAIVDKPELRLIVDKVTKKGWTKMYFSKRVGGGLVDSNAIKLLKFSAS
ncbi:MAG: phage major capsid protein [Erythrobacter sp.]|nr:phage major capsid protein [Erythrobacter sp.]